MAAAHTGPRPGQGVREMRVFVMCPFGTKEGIAFDDVYAKLIQPAIQGLGYRGGSTAETMQSGSIHEVMFLEIIDADLVIADVSIHNANVFYELGIRHALRSRSTVLIRARRSSRAGEGDETVPRPEVPFDIHGLRYLDYDPDQPEQALGPLSDTINATLLAGTTDSPVYHRFPELETRTDGWNRVPLALKEQIEACCEDESRGNLRMLAEDVQGTPFEVPAMRLIAAAQSTLGDSAGAQDSWESVRSQRPDDFEANHALATIYAKADKLTKSDQAIERARSRLAQLAPAQVAELHGLAASNIKSRWLAHFKEVPADGDAEKGLQERRRRALLSSLLPQAIDEYLAGYRLDLGSYYTGLNALALASIRLALAEALPAEWRWLHDSDAEAERAQEELRQLCDWLRTAVRITLDACAHRADGSVADRWLPASRADYRFLTSDEVERVAAAYIEAAHGTGQDLTVSVNRQIDIFALLGFRSETVEALRSASADPPGEAAQHVIVFSGHALDEPGRPRRFPEESRDVVRAELLRTVARIVDNLDTGTNVVAFAAGSDGGDLLFHDVCDELAGRGVRISRELFLPFPPSEFQAKGISRGIVEPYWMELFAQARSGAAAVRVLDERGDRPSWSGQRPGVTSWDRWPRWALHHAVARVSAEKVTALVLWDGKTAGAQTSEAAPDDQGGETGGVRGFVRRVQQVGVPLEMILIQDGKIAERTGHVPVTAPAAGGRPDPEPA